MRRAICRQSRVRINPQQPAGATAALSIFSPAVRHSREGDNAMQYMLLCYANEQQWDSLPNDLTENIMQEIDGIVQDIVRSGHFRAAGRLQPIASSATVREQNGKLLTTDGPLAETKEQLGGYYLIECETHEEALGIARRIAGARPGGTIELRPLRPTFRG